MPIDARGGIADARVMHRPKAHEALSTLAWGRYSGFSTSMARALTSLPTVQPTSFSDGLRTIASSGSGTDHLESRRARIGSPGPATRPGVALKNSSGRLAV